MLLPLDDESRARLVRVAVFFCGSTLLLAPLAGRGSMEIAQERMAFGASFTTPQLPPNTTTADVWVARDPFAPSVATNAAASVEPASPGLMPAEAGSIVRAIVSGATARALVEDGGETRIVELGDSLGGSKVVRIDRSGVTLANGLSLTLQTTNTL